VLSVLLGRKAVSSANISKAATAMRGVSRTLKEGADVSVAQQSVEAIDRQIAELETEVEAQVAALQATEPAIETIELKPARSGVTVRLCALAWKP
jgi:tetrahydromethanopterin S-methyltransferase subunit B